jgi:hypothetical protein
MAQTLELWDKTDMVFPTFSNQFLDVFFLAWIGCPQLRVRLIFIAVVDLCYDYINTKIGELPYDCRKLLGFVPSSDEDVYTSPGLRLARHTSGGQICRERG